MRTAATQPSLEDLLHRTLPGTPGVALYNPLRYHKWMANLFRDHRKLLIVDGVVGFVGGAGIADAFDPPAQAAPGWRETMVRIEGPVLVDWQALFADVWNHYAPTQLAPLTVPAGKQATTASNAVRPARSRPVTVDTRCITWL